MMPIQSHIAILSRIAQFQGVKLINARKASREVAMLAGMFLFIPSCQKEQFVFGELPGDPADLTAAVVRFEEGRSVIRIGKLRSHQFRKLCYGSYPKVSPSGNYVLYDPASDSDKIPELLPPRVIEIRTGKVMCFDQIPKNPTAMAGSGFWSKDSKLFTFGVTVFEGNKNRCVVDLGDGSCWRGNSEEFNSKYWERFNPKPFLSDQLNQTGHPTTKNYKRVGALFFHKPTGEDIRLSPEDMACFDPIWLGNSHEIAFIGRRILPPYGDEDVQDGKAYLIKWDAKDWANAPRQEWDAAIINDGEQISIQ